MLSGNLDIYSIDFVAEENNTYEITDSIILKKPLETILKIAREAAEDKVKWCQSPNESEDVWTDWAKVVQCTSHFLLTFYSSVTFPIFYAKSTTSHSYGLY